MATFFRNILGVIKATNASGVDVFKIDDTGLRYYTTSDGLTAKAGGGQSGATALSSMFNRVTTVATAADSAVLPASVAGMCITVTNAAAANSMNVFPASGDAINALGANAAFALAAGKTAEFVCCTAGQWHAILSA